MSPKFIVMVETAPRTKKKTVYIAKPDTEKDWPYPRYTTYAIATNEFDAGRRVTELNAA